MKWLFFVYFDYNLWIMVWKNINYRFWDVFFFVVLNNYKYKNLELFGLNLLLLGLLLFGLE